MLDAATFVDRALARAEAQLVPKLLAAEVFAQTAGSVRPRLVGAVAKIFARRPWGGWLTREERSRLAGREVRRRTEWPRDEREVVFRLNEQANSLSLDYHVETISRGKEARTLRLFRKGSRAEVGTVRLHAWDPPQTRIRAAIGPRERENVRRAVEAARKRGQFSPLPLHGKIVEVLRGGAWVLGRFGDVNTLVRAEDLIVLDEKGEDPVGMQRRLLHGWASGYMSPELQADAKKYKATVGRDFAEGQTYQRGNFMARWPTGHDIVYLEGPIREESERLVLVRRFGFASHGQVFGQLANARTWTKATRMVDRLAEGRFQVEAGRRTGRVRLPKFGTISGWLEALPDVRARGREAASRYVAALAAADLTALLEQADRDTVIDLADQLQRIGPLSLDARNARRIVEARILEARVARGEVVRGFVGIRDAQIVDGWIIGRQGPYVVAQPPSSDHARSREQTFRRAGFSRRGGGFAAIAHGDPVRAQAAIALAQEAVCPTGVELTELGRKWARAEIERLTADPRALRDKSMAPREYVEIRASKALQQASEGGEKTFWLAVREHSRATAAETERAPLGTCIGCDAYRGVIWKESKGPLCVRCRALNARYQAAEQLVTGWSEKQVEVATRGGWTPDELREHHKVLHRGARGSVT